MRPILVTGANGRLGRALWRIDQGTHPLVGWGGRQATAPYRPVDITDVRAVQSAFAELRPRVVIHLASMLGAACERDPAMAEAVNVGSTANILESARDHQVERIVFASTAAVYGVHHRRPLSEQDEVFPGGVYASTKLRAEQLLAENSGDVAVDVMRIFNVYGPEMVDSLIARLAESNESAPARLNGLDGFVRDYVHVDDVARALLASSDSTSEGHRVFNVGRGIPCSNRDLFEALPVQTRATLEIGPEVDSYSCADISAIRSALSWRPLEPWPPFLTDGSAL